MGNNTVAMFLNDQADIVERRGGEVLNTLKRCMGSGQGTDRLGGPGQMQVLPSHHADNIHVVMAGGNHLSSLGFVHGWQHEPEEVIRQLADQHGFRLVRKPASATPTRSAETTGSVGVADGGAGPQDDAHPQATDFAGQPS